MIRAAILWDSFPSYLVKCIETLARQEDVEVLAYCRAEGAFPNALDELRKYPNIHHPGERNPDALFEEFIRFNPQLAVITLTRRGLFANMAEAWRKSGALVVGANDHWWRGNWRDYANLAISKLGWFAPYEAILVPGSLGKMYARRLGFQEGAIFDGLYTCDTELFRPIGVRRHEEMTKDDWPKAFLFVGQYIRRKGLDILLKAYQAYRRQTACPWELWLVGRGDMEEDLNAPGVRNFGMKSSAQVAELMLQAGCLVLPSRVDHWPLVIHEATSAGLPVLASSMVGSTVELVQSGFNGYVFPVNDDTILSRLMLFMDEGGQAREMGKNSLDMALRFSPALWVKRILQDIPLVLRGTHLKGKAGAVTSAHQ